MQKETGKRKIHFTTLGCPKNQVDTEVMAKMVQRAGFELTANPKEADIITVNTCAFLKASQEESISAILNLSQQKQNGRCKKLIVTGCLPSRHPEEIAKELPEVDHFLGTGDLEKLNQILLNNSAFKSSIHHCKESKIPQELLGERLTDGSPISRYLKISEGCDRRCSFCIIPSIRGDQISRSIDSLVKEAKSLVHQGAKEISLIAQDLTAYGHDLPKSTRLEDLLEPLINEIPNLPWIRLHYVYPQRISDRLIDLLAEKNSLLPYLDMPIQHISSRVLKQMNRATSSDQLRKLLDKLRNRIPDLTLRTTFIVGFPGETDQDFQELYQFLKEFRFEHVGAFMFSQEPGTPAAHFVNQVPEKEKTARFQQLMTLQKQVSFENNQDRIGKILSAMVLGPSEESEFLIKARCEHQAAEIDGLTYITDVGDPPCNLNPGDLVKIHIQESHDYDLAGALAN